MYNCNLLLGEFPNYESKESIPFPAASIKAFTYTGATSHDLPIIRGLIIRFANAYFETVVTINKYKIFFLFIFIVKVLQSYKFNVLLFMKYFFLKKNNNKKSRDNTLLKIKISNS